MTSIVSIAAALIALAYAPSLAQALALNMGSLSDHDRRQPTAVSI